MDLSQEEASNPSRSAVNSDMVNFTFILFLTDRFPARLGNPEEFHLLRAVNKLDYSSRSAVWVASCQERILILAAM